MSRSVEIVLFLLVAAVVLTPLIRRGLAFRRLVHDGVESSGTVVRKLRFWGGNFAIRYTYSDGHGGTHSHESKVSRALWESSVVGGAIDIVYSASNPSLSAPRELVVVARNLRHRS